jgi:hypothetical protein
MKQALKKQSGLTFLGLVFILGIIAMVVVFVLRLFPLYNEKLQIEAALESVISQPEVATMSVADVRRAFTRSLAVTNISRFDGPTLNDHLNIIKATKGQPPMLHFQYQATNKLFADIQLLLVFDKELPLDGSATGN